MMDEFSCSPLRRDDFPGNSPRGWLSSGHNNHLKVLLSLELKSA